MKVHFMYLDSAYCKPLNYAWQTCNDVTPHDCLLSNRIPIVFDDIGVIHLTKDGNLKSEQDQDLHVDTFREMNVIFNI